MSMAGAVFEGAEYGVVNVVGRIIFQVISEAIKASGEVDRSPFITGGSLIAVVIVISSIAIRFALPISASIILMLFAATFSITDYCLEYFHVKEYVIYIIAAGLIAVLEVGGIVERRRWMHIGSLGAGTEPAATVRKESNIGMIEKSD